MIFTKLRSSLWLKLVLASITVEIMMLSILLGNSLRIINNSIDNQAVVKRESITPLLNSALSIPLFERDYATLVNLLDELVHADKSEFIYITVYDDQGKLFAELKDRKMTYTGVPVPPEHILDISADLTIADEKIGTVNYGLSIEELYNAKHTLLNQGMLIAFSEIILTILLLGLTGYFLTRHVGALLREARKISSGDYAVNIDIDTPDEIGLLADEFNTMADSVRSRIEQLFATTRELEIKSAEFETMFNAIADAIIFVDVNRVCVSVNPATLKMFGYRKDKFINQKLGFMYLHEEEYLEQGRLRFAPDSPDRDDSYEATFVRSDGTTFTGELLATRVRDSESKALGFIGILRDITERKMHEEQMRRSQKMDALGKLTGGIAHDFNNMLGVILGYVEIMSLSVEEKSELAQYLKEINNATERGVNLTRKLLSFSSKKSIEQEPVDLNAVLQEEKDMLEKTLTSRIRLIFELQDDLWLVNVDKHDLVDVIINISINAMHAIESNGKITYCTANRTLEPEEASLLNLPGRDYVVLSITDTGCGMDEEQKNRIFEPFYSTKGDKGTGLGMSQVYGFVQRSEGQIRVYSETGHGTRISIYFPRYLGDSQTEASNDDGRQYLNLEGNEKILVVDDEPALLALMAKVLLQHGYTVYSAASGEQALKILKEQDIDLVITDVIMPEMDGYQLAEKIQQQYPQIKVQLVSGFSDDRNSNLVDSALQEHLIQKPYSSVKLLKRVRELLNEKV